ncbi:VOC family protein [Actinomarinicola tropica]|uniref:VOC domain-containing protein n=1 Tax=Actinomarinicola tropica TaxID=2789776 RepID=A0A5Q2RPJ6_9ACTN|nr:VOC family protein [Actinomarinicola tropica]QGG95135.1 hypothetical protein GH723_08505 [Actinomarinicola tropica]
MPSPTFTPGTNLAMKIPRATYDRTVAFYRDVLGFEVAEVVDSGAPTVSASHTVRFGAVTLWLDRVDNYTGPELWLEVRTDDLAAARGRLAEAGIEPCDEVEPLEGQGETSHWIANPAGVIHLLAGNG